MFTERIVTVGLVFPLLYFSILKEWWASMPQTDKFEQQVSQTRSSLSPWETCMAQQDPTYTPRKDAPFPRGQKDFNMTLQQAFESNETVVYFLHQRKAGGTSLRSILFDYYTNFTNYGENRAFIPGYGETNHLLFELPLVEANYLESLKVLGAHMSYHVPFARSLYERRQVLITNFREPVARIKSCMLYRYFDKCRATFESPNFTLASAQDLLMKTRDRFNSSCIQEPFRILSPFDPDKEPVPKERIHEVCCLVRTMFHVVRAPAKVNVAGATVIEEELAAAMRKNPNLNHNLRLRRFSKAAKQNLRQFLKYIDKENPFVKSEKMLYDCVYNTEPSNEAVSPE